MYDSLASLNGSLSLQRDTVTGSMTQVVMKRTFLLPPQKMKDTGYFLLFMWFKVKDMKECESFFFTAATTVEEQERARRMWMELCPVCSHFGPEHEESPGLMAECRHWLILHLQEAGLWSCSRLIFFPSHTHQARPITTHTTDSTK